MCAPPFMQILFIIFDIPYLQKAVNMLYYRQLEMAYLQEVSRWKDLQESGSEKKLCPQNTRRNWSMIEPDRLQHVKHSFHIPAASLTLICWRDAMVIRRMCSVITSIWQPFSVNDIIQMSCFYLTPYGSRSVLRNWSGVSFCWVYHNSAIASYFYDSIMHIFIIIQYDFLIKI